ncbi:MAG: uracil-DNA glycosylase [bacterium]
MTENTERFIERIRTLRKFGIREIFISKEIFIKKNFEHNSKSEEMSLEIKNVYNEKVKTTKVSDNYICLKNLEKEVKVCKRCPLGSSRTNAVFGEGSYSAEIFFIGEAPGSEEDTQGRPFVGRAGHLLDRLLNNLNIRRESVFIGNILKCRPPNNRNPEQSEIDMCTPYLVRQIELINPLVIVALGNCPTQFFTGSKEGITKLRGSVFNWRKWTVVPTYHPAACLRNPNLKKPLWDDVKLILELVKKEKKKR